MVTINFTEADMAVLAQTIARAYPNVVDRDIVDAVRLYRMFEAISADTAAIERAQRAQAQPTRPLVPPPSINGSVPPEEA